MSSLSVVIREPGFWMAITLPPREIGLARFFKLSSFLSDILAKYHQM